MFVLFDREYMIGAYKRKRVYVCSDSNRIDHYFSASSATNDQHVRDQPSKRFCSISTPISALDTVVDDGVAGCRSVETDVDDRVVETDNDVINVAMRRCTTCKESKSVAQQFQARNGEVDRGLYKSCLDCRERASANYEHRKEKFRPEYEALQNTWLDKFRDAEGLLRCACGKEDCWIKGQELKVSDMERDHLVEKLMERGIKKITLDLARYVNCSPKKRAEFRAQFECSQPLHAICHARITLERLNEIRVPDSEVTVKCLSDRHKAAILGMIKCGDICLEHAIEQSERKCTCMGRSLGSLKGRCKHCVPVACNCEAAKPAACANCGRTCIDKKWRRGFHIAHTGQDRTYARSTTLSLLSTVNQVNEIRKTGDRWLCTVCHRAETKHEKRTATAPISNTRIKKRSKLSAEQRDWILSNKGNLSTRKTAELFQQTWNRSVSQKTVRRHWNKA